ncbi:helix-turn-helix transcriptional regulator [Conexibacter stalactiti]|uniref:Helix-turn-helix transcriptional regulator n=1 Tax=Conexibacter stalactiti TaxID=1940611 RepID=A0ABU4HRV0_9ACTN|nr:helix-turn-helix transcriptional regulator [Conexibacter stalactiti]MDW5595417.1 helix-turn-helix transcriptional regulator [Conexibacter stalactiti]MEC5036059.1 helix-turn-helix transcriptional regulator [Conexibacter stalactiti]
MTTRTDDELAGCLRSWRDRLRPADAGLPAGGRRRASGLRREEVAALAGLSVDYLARLEQGRASSPSPSVLAPLARALRLSDAERDHLYRAAGHVPPGSGRVDRHITPGVQRVLDRLADVPVLVIDAAWQVVAINAMGAALLGDFSGEAAGGARENNIAWRQFAGLPSRVAHDAAGSAAFEREIVGDLRDARGRFPDDERLRELIEQLRASVPRFAELWERREVRERSGATKRIVHPVAGPLTLDCDILTTRDSDLRLVVYSAAPGTPDAQALALLGAVGLQSFDG